MLTRLLAVWLCVMMNAFRAGFLATAVLLVTGLPQANAAFVPEDLSFTFLEIGVVPSETFRVSTSSPPQPGDFVTVSKGFSLPIGTSVDLTGRLTNVSSSDVSIAVSNPPSGIPPDAADLILAGVGTQQIPVGSHFGGPVVSAFVDAIDNGFGVFLVLSPGESIDFAWGVFDSSNIVPDGPIEEILWGVTRAQISGGFLDSTGQFGPIVYNEPFYVTLTPAVIPLPAALPLFLPGLAALGFFGWRRKAA